MEWYYGKSLLMVSDVMSSNNFISFLGEVPYCTGDIASTLESLLLFIKDGNRLPRPDQCSDEM